MKERIQGVKKNPTFRANSASHHSSLLEFLNSLFAMGRFIILSGPSCVGKGPLHTAFNNFYPEHEPS